MSDGAASVPALQSVALPPLRRRFDQPPAGLQTMLVRLSGPLGRMRFLSEKKQWGRSVLPARAPHWSTQLGKLRAAVLMKQGQGDEWDELLWIIDAVLAGGGLKS